MKTIEATRHDFEHEGNKWTIYAHRSLVNGEVCLVTLFGPGCEITVEALTCGEGMVMLADALKSLGYRLATEALEREGAYKNPLHGEDK